MQTIIITMIIFMIAIGFMWVALIFAKYKKKKSACCHGDEHQRNGCCGQHSNQI